MKTLNIFIALVTLSFPMITGTIYGQQNFCSVSLEKVRSRNIISFMVPKEVNVSRYRVEAGNDSTDFEVIGSIKPQGNTVFVKSYTYEVFSPAFKYYRIGIEPMGGKLHYSKVMTSRQPDLDMMPYTDPGQAISCSRSE